MTKINWVDLILKTIAVAIGYGLLGKFGYLLALPESHATFIWLPSGLALVAVLQWGKRMAPGIVIGTIIVNFELDPVQVLETMQSFTTHMLIGFGSAAQAILGALAIRKFVGFPNSLNDERSILLFLMWGGAIACLFNATWGTSVLHYFGYVTTEQFLANQLTWWVGDFAGVAVAAPILLMWAQHDHINGRRRAFAVTGAIAVAFSVTILVVAMSINWQRHRLQLEFNTIANSAGTAIAEAFSDKTRILNSLEGYAATNQDMNQANFASYSQRYLDNFKGLTALTWIRYLRHEERADFEAEMRAAGYENFTLIEPHPDGKMVQAGIREDYAAPQFVAPLEPNKHGLGFDVGSNPARRAAFEKAIDTGEIVATQRINLILEDESEYGALVYMPVYKSGQVPKTIAERRAQIEGFMVAVFRIGDIAQNALADFAGTPFVAVLTDLSAPKEEQFLYQNRTSKDGVRELQTNGFFGQNADLTEEFHLSFGQRQWKVEIYPTREFLAQSWQLQNALLILGAGMIFTTVAGIFVLVISGSHERLNKLVQERTSEVEQNRRRLQQAQQIAKIGSWEFDLENENFWCSGEVMEIVGLSEIPQKRAIDFLSALVPVNERSAVRKSLRTENLMNGPVSFSHEIVCKDGTAKDVMQHVELHYENGRPQTIIGTVQDITEMRKLDRLKTEFVATVSHELRTPLTSIKGSIGIMNGGVIPNIPQQAQDLIAIAHANCNRLAHLVDDLLDINGIMSGNLVLQPSKVDLEVIIQQAIALNKAYAEQHRATLALEYCEPSLNLNVDEARLMQVITNLISNASKFSSDPGEVRIRVEKINGRAHISISDNGKGVPKSFHSKIFSRFSQADGSAERQQGGAGLGLYISKEIIDAMKGEIGFHSNDNEGTTFFVSLPLEESA